jgi:hypothetical protein
MQFGSMKNGHLFSERADSGKVIAKYELRGGSKEDRTAAQEWVSMFMHEMVLTFQT